MEIAKSLVKCVARAFYDTKHILVVDALMIHNALRDDDLGRLLGLQTKDLHKLCGKLKEDRMLNVHTRQEYKEGQQRPVNKTYYYVEFRGTIDAVKYRMYGVVKEVEKKMNKDADTKGYVCPYCQKRFAVLDAVSLEQDPEDGLFLCDRCPTKLVDDDDSAEVKTSQERLGRLMEQMKRIVELLKLIDDVVVPTNDFETAHANSVPIPRDKNQLSSIPVTTTTSTKNPSRPATTSLEISITSTSDKTAAELAVEQAKKQSQAEKNALPVWHTQSTVDPTAITTAGAKEAAEKEARALDGIGIAARTKEEEEKKAAAAEGINGVQADAIAEYYAALAAQKAKEEEEEAEEEEEDDEDDDDENFEDVVNSGAVTPAVAPAAAASSFLAGNGGVNGSTKSVDDSDDDSSSAPATKKVKTTQPEEDDSDEEADFEDVGYTGGIASGTGR